MAKQKACKDCKTVYEGGTKCPKCGSGESTESFKGKIQWSEDRFFDQFIL